MSGRGMNEAARKASGGGGDAYVFLIRLGQEQAARYRPGLNWTKANGQRALAVKHINGMAALVSSTLPPPPDRVLETEGLRLLDEAVAARAERIELSSQLATDRDERERIDEIKERFAAGGIEAVTLDEMRAVVLVERGQVYIDEVDRRVREKVETQTPSSEPKPGPEAGDPGP